MGRRPEQTFFQRRNTDSQQAHEKMLHIVNHQGNENQNHSEIITSHQFSRYQILEEIEKNTDYTN